MPSMQRWHGRTVVAALLLGAAATPVPAAELVSQRLDQEGIGLELRLHTIDAGQSRARAGDAVQLQVDARRLADGQPLPNLPIGAWLDHATSVLSGARPSCGQRVANVLGGNLLQRPLLDLTGYHVLTLDAEGSVSVLDPAVNLAGRTSLLTAVQLGGRGFDWVATADDRWLFVAVPERREVVVIDLHGFTIRQRLSVSASPTRLAMSPDGGSLWVAQRGESGSEDRIDVFGTSDGQSRGGFVLPPGHHELAFLNDARHVAISSRDAGGITIADGNTVQPLRTIELGGEPLALLALPQAGGLWVIDGRQGVVHRLTAQGEQIDRIALESGLGPARLTPDGRHVLLVNPAQHRLLVLDAASGAVQHRLTVGGRPYDLFLSRHFAYVRTLDAGPVALLDLSSLQRATPTLQSLPMGAQGIGTWPGLPIASSMGPNMQGNGAFLVSPGDRTVYHYMEGMNAPDSGLRTYGHTPLAVRISQRGLREVARGQYSTTFRLPAQGRMVLALAIDSPRIRHCIDLDIGAGAEDVAASTWTPRWLQEPDGPVPTGGPVQYRFELVQRSGVAPPPAAALRVRVVPGSGGPAQEWPVLADGPTGHYRIDGVAGEPGSYFVHLVVPGQTAPSTAAVPLTLQVR